MKLIARHFSPIGLFHMHTKLSAHSSFQARIWFILSSFEKNSLHCLHGKNYGATGVKTSCNQFCYIFTKINLPDINNEAMSLYNIIILYNYIILQFLRLIFCLLLTEARG